jgi:hypothetical protein
MARAGIACDERLPRTLGVTVEKPEALQIAALPGLTLDLSSILAL